MQNTYLNLHPLLYGKWIIVYSKDSAVETDMHKPDFQES